MSTHKRALDHRDSHIRTLRAACVALCLGCLLLGVGWYKAPTNLTIHNPPDLRSGSTRKWWEIEPSSVYSFAFYVFQQVNRWPTNGEVDYPRNIRRFSPYLTSSCRAFLEKDVDIRRRDNELKDRERSVNEIPERGFETSRVDILSRDAWVVYLDLVTDEHYLAEKVKSSLVRYPIRVVRNDVDPEKNPFGLQLDCFADTPQRLELQDRVAEGSK